jgi:hypothetical protein
MHRKLDHRVGATQAARLNVVLLAARGAWCIKLAGKSNQPDDTQRWNNTNGK